MLAVEPAQAAGAGLGGGAALPEHARLQVDSLLAVMAALEAQLDTLDAELRRFARDDERCQALQSIYGIEAVRLSVCQGSRSPKCILNESSAALQL